MLRPALLVLLVVLLAVPADAQRRRDRDAFARKGDAALTFSIDGLNLQPFQGGVGGRFWVSNRTVIATSLGFQIASGDYDQTRWGTTFSLGAERHFGSSRRVSPFVALGAQVGYAESEYSDVVYIQEPCRPDEPCDPYPYPYDGENRQMSVGVAGFLGAEVKLTEGLTLAAAHSLGVTYIRNSRDVLYYFPDDCPNCYTPDWPDETAERVQFGTGTSSLVLSIYF